MLKEAAEAATEAAVQTSEAEDWSDSVGNIDSAAGILALIAIISGLVNAFLVLVTNDDDLVCERDIAWTRHALELFRIDSITFSIFYFLFLY